MISRSANVPEIPDVVAPGGRVRLIAAPRSPGGSNSSFAQFRLLFRKKKMANTTMSRRTNDSRVPRFFLIKIVS
jgi:hypothetical protein